MAQAKEDVYCTLLMSDSYLPGAAVLAHSLRDAGTTKKLAVLVTLNTLSGDTVERLRELYDHVIPVSEIHNPAPGNLYLMGRPDLSLAFTKIQLWSQVQFRKLVYIDADVVALRALDELFDLEAPFAAAPDIGWPDAFNSGLMVLTPDMGEYNALKTMAAAGDSFDGADQGLLNQYYEHRGWHRLSFTYNCTPNAQYQWEPAYRYYKSGISAVHFIGKNKPWFSGRAPGGQGTYSELVARWWAVYDKHHLDALTSPAPRWSERKRDGRGTGTSVAPSSSIATPEATVVPTLVEPEAAITTTELPLSEPGEPAENIDHGVVEPTPTEQLRKFSAPQAEWDATMFAPPTDSKPEAADFPQATYEFTESRKLFHAPTAYPEPPKDMWYKVPETKPTPTAPPRPIFPWEQQPDRPKATRVFADDEVAQRASVSETAPAAPSAAQQLFTTTHYEGGQGEEVDTSTPERVSSPPIADAFQQSQVNAWDQVPGIEKHVRAIQELQARRAKPQVVYASEEAHQALTDVRKDRRTSLIITDFPSSIERPSLPVTPAPRPTTLWGKDKDEAVELPQAEGVPDQASWNPEERLEQLRRSSLMEFEHLKKPEHPQPPLRAMPEHSVPESEPRKASESGKAPYGLDGASDEPPPLFPYEIEEAKAQTTDEPKDETKEIKTITAPGGSMIFKQPDFDQPESSGARAKEDELSPTQERR